MDRDDLRNLLPLGMISIIVLLFAGFVTYCAGYGSGMIEERDRVQKQAIYYEYGVLTKDGTFLWKEEQLKDNFLKDLEFFKRNKMTPPTDVPRFDPSKPF